ncbi:flagellar basal body P-ring biosynthesis protein FlgA [Pseudoxanthomonas suwonensis]|uniref:Flagella basal body P-ring formation protein FlgA n=2 Tax=Pseudoxanthomonas suwonensis TaxID=314722 RepID=A0A0E3UQ67_9GAMM|nr:flagellar basal body P-ring formation chaperone FlgA [Pseudoxanthomonas suwonensis]AKC88450.1 flagellar basal body P-ring biosynthesis protein FlgA [Pseudoxanthomonas suwonensis]
MFLLGLPMTVALAAGGFQPVESIRAAALGAVPGGQAEASLDPALRMPACGQALQARQASAGTVEVACPDGWRLFVPVKTRRSQTVLVLARGVAAGEAIGADALVAETRDASRIAGAAVADPAQAIGRVARRTLAAGSVLTAGDLAAPRLVRRGDQVALVSRRGGVEVRVAGRALGDAGEDERVSVENLSSRRVLQGRVGPDGEVWVTR